MRLKCYISICLFFSVCKKYLEECFSFRLKLYAAMSNTVNDDSLWNQSVCNQSWGDIMEEEENKLSKTKTNVSNSSLLRDSTNINQSLKSIKEEPLDENACDLSLNGAKNIQVQPNEVLPNFSTSYAKASTSPAFIKENKLNKNEPPKEFLQEDLSLTGHLHGFQIVSPCKVEPKTPTKTNISYLFRADRKDLSSDRKDLSSDRKNLSCDGKIIKRKLQTDNVGNEITDEMLMPSPSKIRKQNTPIRTPTDKLINRKRGREITPAKR